MSRPLTLIAICLSLALPAAADLRVEVDLSERQLQVIENEETIKTYEVAVGTKKNPTPAIFKLGRKKRWKRWLGPKPSIRKPESWLVV